MRQDFLLHSLSCCFVLLYQWEGSYVSSAQQTCEQGAAFWGGRREEGEEACLIGSMLLCEKEEEEEGAVC